MVKLFKFITIICVLVNCKAPEKKYQTAINYITNDTTLVDDLTFIYNYPDSFNKIKSQNFDFQTYDLRKSKMFESDKSRCIKKNNNIKLIEYFESSHESIDQEIENISYSDSASVHIFLSNIIDDMLLAFVFHRDPNYSDPEVFRTRPFDVIWRYNTGRFYLFEFDKRSNSIESVCTEEVRFE